MMNNASLLNLKLVIAWDILCDKVAEHRIDLSIWRVIIRASVSIWACSRYRASIPRVVLRLLLHTGHHIWLPGWLRFIDQRPWIRSYLWIGKVLRKATAEEPRYI